MGELMKLNETKEMAEHFFKSGIFQDVKDMSVALVKIQAGQELGISPIMAMKEVYLIPSKAGVKIQIGASLQAAMIKKSGKYDYRIVDHSKEICTIHFFERRADKWEKIGEESYTIGDAREAGLTANKDVWTKHPKNMLFARAMSNGAKWHCPDVFGGAIYNESDEFPESKFEAEIIEDKPNPVDKHFEIEEEPGEVFLAFKKKLETEAFTLHALDIFAQEIAENTDLLSSNELEELRAIFKEVKTNLNKIKQGEITL
jgi:hypothetical protein